MSTLSTYRPYAIAALLAAAIGIVVPSAIAQATSSSSASAKLSTPRVFDSSLGSDGDGKLRVRPHTIFVGGAGNDQGWFKLRWSSWRSTSAAATGSYLVRAHPGSPSENKKLEWAMRVRLSGVRKCGRQRVFTRIQTRFTHGRPNGYPSNSMTTTFPCR